MNTMPIEPPEFREFPKIARLSREVIISEKIDGTNAQIFIGPGCPLWPGKIHAWFDHDTQTDMVIFAGSKTRWITPANDNHGFARWAAEHAEELKLLGPGRHFGEWWGQGIQRKYGLAEKRWSLFNTVRWVPFGAVPQQIPCGDPRIVKMQDILPPCCHLVPILARGIFQTQDCDDILAGLVLHGSYAAPGFMNPEGIVCWHTAANIGFKKTIKNDDTPKSMAP